MARVYALVDPRNDKVRYVGQSKYTQTRYMQHVHNVSKDNPMKWLWINELKLLGLLPTYIVLEEGVRWEQRFIRETYWINYHLNLGAPLTNLLEGNRYYDGTTKFQAEERLEAERQKELIQLMEDM